jgi:hypothetical protein
MGGVGAGEWIDQPTRWCDVTKKPRIKKSLIGADVTKRSGGYLRARVGWKVVKAFSVEAKRRGRKRSWLIERVLSAMVIHDLFKAVITEKDDDKT